MFILVLVLGLCAVIAGVAVAALPPGGTFTDDDGNIHEGNIEAIAADGVTKGCNPPANTLYCPDSTVTRGQMAAFLNRALGLPATNTDFFSDDDGTTFEGDINRLAAAGITKGCNPPANTLYCPDGAVTRGQMAAFLVRAFGYTDDGGGDLFIDDDDSIFEANIDRLGTAGVTKGCNPPVNDRYCPNSPVLRDQMASFLARALGLTAIKPPPVTTSTTTIPSTAPWVSWTCDFASYPDIRCQGNTDPLTYQDEHWGCDEGSTWACAGEIDATDPALDSWGCYATSSSGYICQGDIDNRTYSDEMWACVVGSDNWYCSGNIDITDSAHETWDCQAGTNPDWLCTGDVDKGFAGDESFACSIGGPVGRAWECTGSQTWLAPIVSNPDFLLSWSLLYSSPLATHASELVGAAPQTPLR